MLQAGHSPTFVFISLEFSHASALLKNSLSRRLTGRATRSISPDSRRSQDRLDGGRVLHKVLSFGTLTFIILLSNA